MNLRPPGPKPGALPSCATSRKNGALGRNRTHNLLIRSQALYPVELLAHINGAQGRSRTGTDFKVRRILSPVRLPISPPGHSLMEVPTGLEPMMTELQSVALPTWPRNHFFILFRVSYHAAPLLYAIKIFFAIVFYNFLQSIFYGFKISYVYSSFFDFIFLKKFYEKTLIELLLFTFSIRGCDFYFSPIISHYLSCFSIIVKDFIIFICSNWIISINSFKVILR